VLACVGGAAAHVVAEEVLERALPEDVGKPLLPQHAGLHVLCPHQVEQQPRADGLERLLGRRLREGLLLVERDAAHARHVSPHQLRHLR